MIKFGLYTTFYNCEKFVDKIFTSVENINYDNFEWHITDDFSTDNTEQLIKDRLNNSDLKHKIKYYRQTEKKQMYWKPNLFFNENFEWIILLDADDDFDPNFLKIYNHFLEKNDDISLISSDFIKMIHNDNSLHSISYILNDDDLSSKNDRYHPKCDYLNNISYSCFGHLRGFKNIIKSFDVNDMMACAEDSYHVFWANSYGKYLNIPRALYIWNLREDSESHSKIVPPNFNANFDIAINKLKSTDGGVDKTFNDIYIETSTLMSYPFGEMVGKRVSLWSRALSKGQEKLLQSLYYDVNLTFNNFDADIHIFALNYINNTKLNNILKEVKNNKCLFYYQNQKLHDNNQEKDEELQTQINNFLPIISRYKNGYNWWSYIRHFIVKAL